MSSLTGEQLETLRQRAERRFAPVENSQNLGVNEVYVHLQLVRDAFVKWADGEIAEASTPAAHAVNKVKELGR